MFWGVDGEGVGEERGEVGAGVCEEFFEFFLDGRFGEVRLDFLDDGGFGFDGDFLAAFFGEFGENIFFEASDHDGVIEDEMELFDVGCSVVVKATTETIGLWVAVSESKLSKTCEHIRPDYVKKIV